MKPGFVHSYFLLIYLRLSKPMYFPSRYHRKDKSKNLVYFSQTIVRKKFYKLYSFIYRYVYFFFRILFANQRMNFFGQPFPTLLLPTSAIFLHFFFLISVSYFFLSPPHLFFFRFDFVLKLYKAVSRDTDRVTFALAV